VLTETNKRASLGDFFLDPLAGEVVTAVRAGVLLASGVIVRAGLVRGDLSNEREKLLVCGHLGRIAR
jgi:hypothetical protein